MRFFLNSGTGIVLGLLQITRFISIADGLGIPEVKEKIYRQNEIIEIPQESTSENNEKTEEAEFGQLLTESARTLRQLNSEFIKKLVLVADTVGKIMFGKYSAPTGILRGLNPRGENIKAFEKARQFRNQLIATAVEWFHLLKDHEKEQIIRSKLESLNKKIYAQFREDRDLMLKLIDEFLNKSFKGGLTTDEQMKLMKMFVKSGAIERVKCIASHEMARQLHVDLPGKDSLMKSISDMMVDKVFDEKYKEIEKQANQENNEQSVFPDPDYCTRFTCKEYYASFKCPTKCGIHANLKVALLNDKKEDLFIAALNPRSRKVRSADESSDSVTKEDKSVENVDLSDYTEDLNQYKRARHSFKTRKHGDTKTDIVKESITLDVKENVESDPKKMKGEGEDKIHISVKEEQEIPVKKSKEELPKDGTLGKESKTVNKQYVGDDQGLIITKTFVKKEKTKSIGEFDITKQLFPKFQEIYNDRSTTSMEKDHKMIQLITDMMSKPMVQEGIVAMLEKHLKNMDVKMATHLVLMAMQRTSFGSDENVLEQMFDTWEPLLSTTIGLLGHESLAKVCEIHANVEKIATPEKQKTLRILTKNVFAGLKDRTMAKRLERGMTAALAGNHNDIMNALREEHKEKTVDAEEIVEIIQNVSEDKNVAKKDPQNEKKSEKQQNFEQQPMFLTSDMKRKNLLEKNPMVVPPASLKGRQPKNN